MIDGVASHSFWQKVDTAIMQHTLYTDGFLFESNPSPVGGGYTVVDRDGNLVEREQILKSDFTNNEA